MFCVPPSPFASNTTHGRLSSALQKQRRHTSPRHQQRPRRKPRARHTASLSALLRGWQVKRTRRAPEMQSQKNKSRLCRLLGNGHAGKSCRCVLSPCVTSQRPAKPHKDFDVVFFFCLVVVPHVRTNCATASLFDAIPTIHTTTSPPPLKHTHRHHTPTTHVQIDSQAFRVCACVPACVRLDTTPCKASSSWPLFFYYAASCLLPLFSCRGPPLPSPRAQPPDYTHRRTTTRPLRVPAGAGELANGLMPS